jgi:hypothetical protein
MKSALAFYFKFCFLLLDLYFKTRLLVVDTSFRYGTYYFSAVLKRFCLYRCSTVSCTHVFCNLSVSIT